MLFWVVTFIAWYLFNALFFLFVLNYPFNSSLLWLKFVLEHKYSIFSVVVSWVMLTLGVVKTRLELKSKFNELERKESSIEEREKKIKKEYSNLKSKREEYKELKESIDNLKEEREELLRNKDELQREINNLSSKKSLLLKEIRKVNEKLRSLKSIIELEREKGYKDGYQKVIEELRSLRKQKSAVLDLFEDPDFDNLLKRKFGEKMTIKRYLNSIRRKKDADL